MTKLYITPSNQINVDTVLKPFSITVDAPYNLVFHRARVAIPPRRQGVTIRRYIQFNTDAKIVDKDMAARLPTNASTYARYLMNCHLWKTEGRILTEEEEVDHVNGNALDDRIDNFEIVSREENIRRRDFTQYASWGITQPVLDMIRSYLEAGENRRYIASEMGITMGYLRYLIHTYFPLYDSGLGVERDIADIIKRRTEGETFNEIADSYGVSRTTMQRIVEKHAPDVTGQAKRDERREYISNRAKEGAHYNEIAQELGCTPTNVWYYIKQHLPDIAKIYRAREREHHSEVSGRNRALVAMIAPFINAGVTYTELEQVLGAKKGRLQDVVTKYDKENIVKTLPRSRPRSEKPSVAEVIARHPELKDTLDKIVV